jgi:predicted ester cyclase
MSDIVRKHFELVNANDFDELAKLICDDVVVHTNNMGDIVGVKNYVDIMSSSKIPFNDYRDTIVDVIADDAQRKYCVHGVRTASLAKSLMGVEPKGQRIETTWICIFRIDESGRIAERWHLSDDLKFLQQIGVLGGGGGSGGHGHSHDGKPCHGHGHGHGDAASASADQHDAYAASSSSSSAHGHSHNGQPCHGHGGGDVPKRDASHRCSFPVRASAINVAFLRLHVADLLGAGVAIGGAKNLGAQRTANPLDAHEVLEVSSVDGATTKRVVACLPNGGDAARQIFFQSSTYERAVGFYEHFADVLASDDVRSFKSPRAYFSAYDGKSDDYCLLLDDLSARTRAATTLGGLSVAQAKATLVAAARMHARYWHDGSDSGGAFRALCTQHQWLVKPPATVIVAAQSYQTTYPAFVKSFASKLPQTFTKVAEAMLTKLPLLYQRNYTPPITICHNDLRVDHLRFEHASDDDDAPITGVYISSWQEMGLGRPARDIASLLVHGLKTDERQAHQDELLHAYHDALVEAGVTSYAFDDLLADYKLFTIAVLVANICNGTGLLRLERARRLRPDQKPLLLEFRVVLTRVMAAIADLNVDKSLELLPRQIGHRHH